MNYEEYVNGKKTLLIAPAGYGKTYTIAHCLNFTVGKQLILTHTHAGISSIKQKIKEANISSAKYHIETISSFVQKYVHAFYIGSDIPEQDDSNNYHTFIINKANILFRSKLILNIIKQTYQGLFVDEYQDCTQSQHAIILEISNVLPTHILGDPLQGIFNFNNDLVNFDQDLEEFTKFPALTTPHRWNESNPNLGTKLKEIRACLENGENIQLSDDTPNKFRVIDIADQNIFNVNSDYQKEIKKIISNRENNQDLNNLLIIYPNTAAGAAQRLPLKNIIDPGKSLKFLESIDDNFFYKLAKNTDNIIEKISDEPKKITMITNEILLPIFNKTELKLWFNENSLVRRTKQVDKDKSALISKSINIFIESPKVEYIKDLLLLLKKELKFKIQRDEPFQSLISSLEQSKLNNISVLKAMNMNRNLIRRLGRNISGKCLGTTLLTKGLEFDTVVIINAHEIKCPKNLYVAFTRCCRSLIIFTKGTTLSPYA